jgi:hypothetical protein
MVGTALGASAPVGVGALSAGVLVGVSALPAWGTRGLEAGYRVACGRVVLCGRGSDCRRREEDDETGGRRSR